MNKQQYEERNLKGFEADSFLKERVAEVIKEKGIKRVIECGTFLGGTTMQLAKMVPAVDTIEINDEYFRRASQNIIHAEGGNVMAWKGNSLDILPKLLPSVIAEETMFFLDDHWYEQNPLIEQLEMFAEWKLKPAAILIHDFKVPGHPELGFDTYENIVYEWDWIAESVEKVYGKDGYAIEYNSKANGAMRGVLWIFPR